MRKNKSTGKLATPQLLHQDNRNPYSGEQSEQNDQDTVSEEEISILPPFIITNPRNKIEPEHIDQKEFCKVKEKHIEMNALVWLSKEEKKAPIPKHPIFLSWEPRELCFQLYEKPVIKRLFVCNRSPKIMYIYCCGLWDDTARLGASWRCHPRTRILLAPGLVAEINIRAKPRDESPVPFAYIGLQIAAAHRKDTVVGYFVVPIAVAFHNYVLPKLECESEQTEENGSDMHSVTTM